MGPLTYKTKFTVALVLLVPCILSLWMLAVPHSVSSSTYAAFTLLVIGIGMVMLNTYRNSRPTDSMGQLLHVTDTAKGIRMPDAGPASANRSRS